MLTVIALLGGCGSMATSEVSRRTDAEIEMARQRQSEEKAEITNPATYLSLIRRMQEQGLYYASLAHIDAYQQRFGGSPDVLLLRADALRETDQLVAAEADYRKVVGATSAASNGSQGALLCANAWRGLGITAGRQGQFAEAARRLEIAARSNPTDATTASDLGYALMRAGDVDEARVPLMQAAQLDAANPKIAGNLAIWLTVNDRKEEASAIVAHAQLNTSARKAIDEDAGRVRNAWRDRRLARHTVPVATVALRPAAAQPSLGLSANTTVVDTRGLQRGRLLDTFGAAQ
ncbi:MAG: tetratricopeptide repeat protein [Pseudomonadota bacterium]|nr:tetratricopeptide repeat protein [Ralstonia pickettii]MEE2976881.1 tetratricopeptide repeat protein [Pseudomonadota bacterium]WKZ88256.1 tetratricopeptide repeat protein [Ralstonia pickettii]